MWHVGQRICLSLLMKSEQKKTHQHSAPGHLIMSHPIRMLCTDPLVAAAWSEWPSDSEVGQDTWRQVWEKKQKKTGCDNNKQHCCILFSCCHDNNKSRSVRDTGTPSTQCEGQGPLRYWRAQSFQQGLKSMSAYDLLTWAPRTSAMGALMGRKQRRYFGVTCKWSSCWCGLGLETPRKQ